jgi:hypothetical protein
MRLALAAEDVEAGLADASDRALRRIPAASAEVSVLQVRGTARRSIAACNNGRAAGTTLAFAARCCNAAYSASSCLMQQTCEAGPPTLSGGHTCGMPAAGRYNFSAVPHIVARQPRSLRRYGASAG